MPAIKPIKFRNLGIYGVIRESEVDSSLIPDGALTEALNVHFDRKGAVTLRNGITALGSQISSGNSCLGLYNALFTDSNLNKLLAVFSNGSINIISEYDGSSWSTSLSGDTNNLKTRFASFADRTIRVNGTNTMRVFDGSAWSNSGNPINADDMNAFPTKYIDVHKSRVYTAGNSTNPDRLFYSSVIDSSGNITWTPGTDFIDINPSDGENLSGLKRYSLELLLFKPNYIYRFRTSGADPDPLIKLGTRSQESIIEGKKGVYFHHDTGIYLYTGGYPREISRPVSDFINNITLANYSNVSSWKDNDHVYFSAGDITINGTTYTNIVFVYTESSEIWSIYSYASELTMGATYNTGSAINQVVGDDDGYVLTFNSGTTDNTSAINYNINTKWYDLGNIASRKTIQEMISLCEKAQGAMLQYQIDDDPRWYDLGTLRKYLNYHTPLSIKFHRIRFKLYGSSTTEPFIFQGLEATKALDEGVIIE